MGGRVNLRGENMGRKQHFWNLFVYGSLTRKEVIRRYINRVPKSKKAVLKGWKRILNPVFFPYPFLIEDDLSEVEGLCYFCLSDKEMDKLDHYESCNQSLYRRKKIVVEVMIGGGEERVEAEVYVGDMLEKEYKKYLRDKKI